MYCTINLHVPVQCSYAAVVNVAISPRGEAVRRQDSSPGSLWQRCVLECWGPAPRTPRRTCLYRALRAYCNRLTRIRTVIIIYCMKLIYIGNVSCMCYIENEQMKIKIKNFHSYLATHWRSDHSTGCCASGRGYDPRQTFALAI